MFLILLIGHILIVLEGKTLDVLLSSGTEADDLRSPD